MRHSDYLELAAPFQLSDIEWTIRSLSSDRRYALVCARIKPSAIINRLDTVFGAEGWFDSYEPIQAGMKCTLTIGEATKTREFAALDPESEPNRDESELRAHALFLAASDFGLGSEIAHANYVWVTWDAERQQVLETPIFPKRVPFAKPVRS